MSNFSVIICSYNPDTNIFNRLLKAIGSFSQEILSRSEVIIVDNRSTSPLARNKDVQSFLAEIPTSSLIVEETPGLTSARLSGITKAKNDWLVFFDDDNEPARNYLEILEQEINKHPNVGAWGPGNITVEFTGKPDAWLITKKIYFQERKEVKTVYDNDDSTWHDYYPFGTGLCIKKEIAKVYSDKVKNNEYTLSDRNGKSLSSGGDVQMVLTGIKTGYSAGSIYNLQLTHLINSAKANLKYLVKQQYGTTSAFVTAYNQVVTDKQIPVTATTNFEILRKIYSFYRIHKRNLSANDFKLFVADKLGEVKGGVVAIKQDKPFALKVYEKLIGYN